MGQLADALCPLLLVGLALLLVALVTVTRGR